ncbi:hypothetical protein DXT68_00220 [Microbacterium foliorum]|nr:hypothetical protein DXT68_00220 [Microbacterium foliorum]
MVGPRLPPRHPQTTEHGGDDAVSTFRFELVATGRAAGSYYRCMEPTSNPLRALGDGGPGFCFDIDRDLFRGAGDAADGPLLIALDSNVIFDLERYGSLILDQEHIPGVDDAYREELEALGAILDLWMVRDIRFIVVPRTRHDFKKSPSPERLAARERLFQRIEDALTFQADDWGAEHQRFTWSRPVTPATRAVLDVSPGLDALMLESAWSAGVDAFLTLDAGVIKAAGAAMAPFPLVVKPTQLANRLHKLGPNPFLSGRVDHPDCLWEGGLPFGDSGKWVPLLEALFI